MKFKLIITICTTLIVVLLAGCGQPTSRLEAPMLQYASDLYLESDGELAAELCVSNEGIQDFPGADDFLGVMSITTGRTLRAKAEIYQLPKIAAGEEYCPLRWTGFVSPGEHQLTWGEKDSKQSTTRFQIDQDLNLSILADVE